MKHLPVVILVLMAGLVAAVTGCRGSRVPDDARLVAADSLMASDPDSALALVEVLAPDSLATDGDRAYRILLLTQARYKCYITATSDSDINRALGYYRAHSDQQEKLTRAYIYKGAVMEELGHPDSAMLYYKHAEATANEKDYINLGYINLRIADLYRKYFGDKEICFKKYHTALKYYELTGDRFKQQNCLYNMGMCAGITHNSDPVELLNQAMHIALELNDSSLQFECMELLCRQYTVQENHREEAKELAMKCLNNYKDYISNELLLDISLIYAYENNLDSALYFTNLVNENLSHGNMMQIKFRKFEVLAIVAKRNGQNDLNNNYCDSINQLSEQITNNKERYHIQNIENYFQDAQDDKRTGRINSLTDLVWLLISIIIAVVVLMGLLTYLRIRRVNSIVQELRDQGIRRQEDFMKTINSRNELLSQFLESIAMLMQTAIKVQSTKEKINLDKKIKSTIVRVANKNFWDELKSFLDNNYNNIITTIATNPSINERDVKFIELSCLGFSYLEIAITLGYAPNYISRKRKILAQKLQIDGTLQDYLENLMKKTK